MAALAAMATMEEDKDSDDSDNEDDLPTQPVSRTCQKKKTRRRRKGACCLHILLSQGVSLMQCPWKHFLVWLGWGSRSGVGLFLIYSWGDGGSREKTRDSCGGCDDEITTTK